MTAPMSAEPLFRAQFTLTRADALAWEMRLRDLSGRERLILFSLTALGGMTYGATEQRLPVWFLLLHPIVQFALIALAAYGLWRMSLRTAAHVRAARRTPALCRFEDWGDHFTYAEGAVTHRIAPEMLLAVTATNRHIRLTTADLAVLLPLSAFPDATTARATAETWQARVDLAASSD